MAEVNEGQASLVETAVAEGGAYEVIRKRLEAQGLTLEEKTRALNAARIEEIGSTDLESIARVRVRTENNCIARDLVQVGDCLLFGYNVFIGLKKQTKVEDVFALFKLSDQKDGHGIEPSEHPSNFLAQPRFLNDFRELYEYYKNARLIQLTVNNGKLLAGFQIGEKLTDIRVFRWSVSADGSRVEYIDNRGERDIQLPPAFDFEWQASSREDFVNGRHPHINILDTLFVDNLDGSLGFKVENNTESGLGVFSEPLTESNQSLDDLELFYAKLGDLLLIRVLPYREEEWRHYVFNSNTQLIERIDSIGESCVQLPEDHGLIYPDGYYLQSGESKNFGEMTKGFKFKRSVRSPNGEDFLFVFYEPVAGRVALFSYNLIERSLQNPIFGNGYARAENGKLVIFTSEDEPTRVHPMQVWQTPFTSQEFADQAPTAQSFFGKIGNSALVRGVSDLYRVCKQIRQQQVTAIHYERIQKNIAKSFDAHYWLSSEELGGLDAVLKSIADTSELIIDEFEKVTAIREQSSLAIEEAVRSQGKLIGEIDNASLEQVAAFVDFLDQIRHQRGHLATIAEYRYIDADRIATLDQELKEKADELGKKTIEFLAEEGSLLSYTEKIEVLEQQLDGAKTATQFEPVIEEIESIAGSLDLLSELVTTLKVDDSTVRTKIIDGISSVYAQLNQTKASAEIKKSDLTSEEAVAQFAAQFKLLSQSINNALSLATDPEKCDEQLSRLLVQLEELESQFGEHDRFLSDIVDKREEIYDGFESHKQQLVEGQQRRIATLQSAAERMLNSIDKRSTKFNDADELNTYLVSDALVLKISDLTDQLIAIGGNLQADDIGARLKLIKDQALRSLRDKSDIFESGGKVIKLGDKHRFTVNTEELDLSIIPIDEHLSVHLSGTQYFDRIDSNELEALQAYWGVSLESESDKVCRAEYLAYQFTLALRAGEIATEELGKKPYTHEQLYPLIQKFAAPLYKQAYEKGIHDHDAARITECLLPILESAGPLVYSPESRALAMSFWYQQAQINTDGKLIDVIAQRAKSAFALKKALNSNNSLDILVADIIELLSEYQQDKGMDLASLTTSQAANYLLAELEDGKAEFSVSPAGRELLDLYYRKLGKRAVQGHATSLAGMRGDPMSQWALSRAWFLALLDEVKDEGKRAVLSLFVDEAVAVLNWSEGLDTNNRDAELRMSVDGLLSSHARIADQSLSFTLDDFMHRMQHHQEVFIPEYKHFIELKQKIAAQQRSILRLESFKPRPLSSFVRNKLIDQAYLPIIGDNLAKQMGTVGDSKRTDLMGLLMMISPPGYGKTTLMEYVASRLGLIFMKINCPALGHDVVSVDPQQASNATAQQELEKLNLAFEMGNNVMLYLDDIQHTNSEFLQKFISLCDATRRIEGVWRGDVKTYDLRGRRFCVVMAGNPYTESGESFKVPDMLANRADIYNLGDILSGMDEVFALSYIENCLTSNSTLAPLAARDMQDVYHFIDMAKGRDVPTTDLSHSYSGAEVSEIVGVLKKLFVVQNVILRINQQYIASAAQEDKYRVEPPFLLQGSYRNMNKMAEKISAVMNNDELEQLVDDHYLGEAQLLTTGTEANLLKLAELRGVLDDEQDQRWQQIKDDFLRNKSLGGDADDVGNRIATQLADLVSSVSDLDRGQAELDSNYLAKLAASAEKIAQGQARQEPNIEVVNQPNPELANVVGVLTNTIESTLFPILRSMDKKLDIDLRTQEKMHAISEQLRALQKSVE